MRILFTLLAILFLSGCVGGVRNVPYNIAIPKLSEAVYQGECEPILRIKSSVASGEAIISSNGTAFLTTYNGEVVIVTAFHVASGATQHRFYTKDRQFIQVDIAKIRHIPSIDATIIYPSYISAKIKPFEFKRVTIGEDCNTIGFPSGGERTEYKGRITSSALSSTARVDQGMSGGPVLHNGKVIGIVSAKVTSSSDNTRSYLVRLSDAFDILKAVPVPLQKRQVYQSISGKQTQQQVYQSMSRDRVPYSIYQQPTPSPRKATRSHRR